MFTAPREKTYLVTLTANLLMNTHKTTPLGYAELFIMKNGKLTALEHYLVVEQGKVANLRTKISLQQGEVLSVFVGYHVKSKHAYGPSGTVTRYDVPHLDTVRLCIF